MSFQIDDCSNFLTHGWAKRSIDTIVKKSLSYNIVLLEHHLRETYRGLHVPNTTATLAAVVVLGQVCSVVSQDLLTCGVAVNDSVLGVRDLNDVADIVQGSEEGLRTRQPGHQVQIRVQKRR